MKLVDADLLKSILDKGEIVIGEDILQCESGHDVLVYLLTKVDMFLEKVIDGLPSVGWIPCSERLPDGCEDAELEVLVYTEEKYIEAEFEEVGFALYYPGEKKFRSVYGERVDITDMVIAWMPLPQPYKGE